jgi:hypothetical protein
MSPAVIARLDRATQYAAAFVVNLGRFWNTGSPTFAGDDSGGCGARLPSFSIPAVIARLDRATQYAAAIVVKLGRLWNTGFPAFAEDDSGGCGVRLPR